MNEAPKSKIKKSYLQKKKEYYSISNLTDSSLALYKEKTMDIDLDKALRARERRIRRREKQINGIPIDLDADADSDDSLVLAVRDTTDAAIFPGYNFGNPELSSSGIY